MKKIILFIGVLTAALLLQGCSTTETETKSTQGNSVISETQEETAEAENLESDPVYSVEVVDYLAEGLEQQKKLGNGYWFDEEGSLYFIGMGNTPCLDTFISYLDKDVRQLIVDRDHYKEIALAVLNDGSLQCGEHTLFNELDIVDIALHDSTNASIFVMDADGTVYRLDYPYAQEGVYALNRAMSDVAAFEASCVGWAYVFRDGSYLFGKDAYESKDKIDAGWKDVVYTDFAVSAQSTGTNDLENDILVALGADGTLYAVGKYSEEILEWEEIANITVDLHSVLAVTKDGELKAAGKYGQKYLDVIEETYPGQTWSAVKFVGGLTYDMLLLLDTEGHYYIAGMLGEDAMIDRIDIRENTMMARTILDLYYVTKDGSITCYEFGEPYEVEKDENGYYVPTVKK